MSPTYGHVVEEGARVDGALGTMAAPTAFLKVMPLSSLAPMEMSTWLPLNMNRSVAIFMPSKVVGPWMTMWLRASGLRMPAALAQALRMPAALAQALQNWGANQASGRGGESC
jgi:hypothetical protein